MDTSEVRPPISETRAASSIHFEETVFGHFSEMWDQIQLQFVFLNLQTNDGTLLITNQNLRDRMTQLARVLDSKGSQDEGIRKHYSRFSRILNCLLNAKQPAVGRQEDGSIQGTVDLDLSEQLNKIEEVFKKNFGTSR